MKCTGTPKKVLAKNFRGIPSRAVKHHPNPCEGENEKQLRLCTPCFILFRRDHFMAELPLAFLLLVFL